MFPSRHKKQMSSLENPPEMAAAVAPLGFPNCLPQGRAPLGRSGGRQSLLSPQGLLSGFCRGHRRVVVAGL